MSLNGEQQEGTRRELQQNLELSRLSASEIVFDLGWTPERLAVALAVDDASDPVDVWLLRDYLERAIRDAGGVPAHYTVLTEDARSSAQRWFGLKLPPRASSR